MIYKGSGGREKPVYGKACRYRIPALAVSKKGTILAFAEARRLHGNDLGDIDAVVKRSEDGGKTWGPEILIIDDGPKSVNNHSPVVDPKTGRIWVVGNVSDINPRPVLVSYSDDDGKTWSKAKDIQKELLTPNPNAVIFGAGPRGRHRVGARQARGPLRHTDELRFRRHLRLGRGLQRRCGRDVEDRRHAEGRSADDRGPVCRTPRRFAALQRAHHRRETRPRHRARRWLERHDETMASSRTLPDPNCQGSHLPLLVADRR